MKRIISIVLTAVALAQLAIQIWRIYRTKLA